MRLTGSMECAGCGMLVEPPVAFHPWLYCRLFELGVLNPAEFLEGQHFIPDPDHWGEGAPARQTEAAAGRGTRLRAPNTPLRRPSRRL